MESEDTTALTPLVSFVIPVRDDAARLRRCLQSLARSTYPRERLQVIVADNGSTDGSDLVAVEAGATVLRLPGLRVGELRNRGVQVAAGEILAFVDADHEIVPDWVSNAVETLLNHRVGAVGAPYHPPPDATRVQRLYNSLRSHHTGRPEVTWLGTGNMAIKRNAFQQVGGFDITLDTCEDVDLCRRLRAIGYRLISDERLYNVHYGDPATLRAIFMGELWRGKDNFRVSLRRPVTSRTVVSLILSIVTLLATASVIAGTILGLASPSGRGPVIAAAAAFLVLLLTLLRTGWMLRHIPETALGDLLCAPSVAFTYELGRALALVFRITHRHRRATS